MLLIVTFMWGVGQRHSHDALARTLMHQRLYMVGCMSFFSGRSHHFGITPSTSLGPYRPTSEMLWAAAWQGHGNHRCSQQFPNLPVWAKAGAVHDPTIYHKHSQAWLPYVHHAHPDT